VLCVLYTTLCFVLPDTLFGVECVKMCVFNKFIELWISSKEILSPRSAIRSPMAEGRKKNIVRRISEGPRRSRPSAMVVCPVRSRQPSKVGRRSAVGHFVVYYPPRDGDEFVTPMADNGGDDVPIRESNQRAYVVLRFCQTIFSPSGHQSSDGPSCESISLDGFIWPNFLDSTL